MKEINIKSSTVEKGLDLAKEFLQSVMKPSLDELGELFADKVKLWRLNNQIRNIEKVKAIVEKEGITTKAINMKVLFPYLDAVALEEDETLQDMWANLFVNYIDSEKNLTLTVYPEILRQLSTNELRFIQSLHEKKGSSGVFIRILEGIASSEEEINNLQRLELIEEVIEVKEVDWWYKKNNTERYKGREPEYKFMRTGRFKITNFGKDFINACTRGNQING